LKERKNSGTRAGRKRGLVEKREGGVFAKERGIGTPHSHTEDGVLRGPMKSPGRRREGVLTTSVRRAHIAGNRKSRGRHFMVSNGVTENHEALTMRRPRLKGVKKEKCKKRKRGKCGGSSYARKEDDTLIANKSHIFQTGRQRVLAGDGTKSSRT